MGQITGVAKLPEKPSAYSYVRMSTDAQLRGDSRRRQLAESRRFALERGFQLVEDFEDLGVSAYRGKNVSAGALGRFLDLVRQKKISKGSYLLIESLDRLSRQEILKSLSIFTDILGHGVNIATLKDGHIFHADKTDFADLVISLGIMSRANEESSIKSFRVASAWAQKRADVANRKLTSRCPAWLRLNADKSSFEVDKARVKIIRRIFEDCSAGIGNYSITKRLNKEAVPAFTSQRGWHTSSIAKILANRSVLGEFQPHRLIDGKRVAQGEPIPNYFPRIIPEDLFYRAENARVQRRFHGAGRKGKFVSNLFSGFAECAYCGSAMRFENKGQGPKRGTFLVCERAQRGLGCFSTRWRYDDFEASFLTFVRELNLASIVQTENQAQRQTLIDDEIAGMRGRITASEAERERAFSLLKNADLAASFITGKLEAIEKEITALKERLSAKERERSELSAEIDQFYQSKDQIKSLLAEFKRPTKSDLYRVRAQISSRLKSVISQLFIAPFGGVPFLLDTINMLKAKRKPNKSKIAELERMLPMERTTARYFTVRFKDGSLRIVVPNRNDPLQFDIQIAGTDDDMQRFEPGKTAIKFAGDPSFSKLVNRALN